MHSSLLDNTRKDDTSPSVVPGSAVSPALGARPSMEQDCTPTWLTANSFVSCDFFLKKLFIHEKERERERQRHRQREKQAPRREPDMGLDPWTPGSCPGLKEGSKPLSHPGIPRCSFYLANSTSCNPPSNFTKQVVLFSTILQMGNKGSESICFLFRVAWRVNRRCTKVTYAGSARVKARAALVPEPLI